ncbi:hypothetical protein [Demequina pelophila]|uniref:hypothetical protein n=1 Tax=Demequina pelophila TaxID=1638984 RepID=UPI000783CCEA|nr:hypothetical protein [Demequina pelophila]
MGDDGWSRAMLAASGVPVSGGTRDDALRAIVMEARAARLGRSRLIELSTHRSPDVREAIAARHDCPLGVQGALLHDRRPGVRVSLAANPMLAGSIAGHLARDRDVAVLKALARSATAPAEVLRLLAEHRREDVARIARRALAGGAAQEAARTPAAELEDGPRPARPVEADASPATGRVARMYAPRPVARTMARPVLPR